MAFIARVGDRYYYNRRVPEEVREFDPRVLIRVSLKTDSKAQAKRKAVFVNDQIEAYWQTLLAERVPHDVARYKQTVLLARQLGFAYQPMSAVGSLPLADLIDRVRAFDESQPKQIEAALGGKPVPETTVRQAMEKFWDLAKDKVINKTEHQVRKWQNPRKKAVENFVALFGDKKLTDITRDDIIGFRDWWIERIKSKGKNEDSANKNLMQLKCIIETVSDHEKLGVQIDYLFKKVKLRNRYRKVRGSFTSEQIVGILKSQKLLNMNDEARWFLHVMAETGARPSEIVGLLPEDIRLDAEIPYIAFTDRKDRPLKTPQSQREVPLVGFALEAFHALPNGFPHYRDRPDSLTTFVNKFLRDNDLLPSENHTLYSLRHSFQDRLLTAKIDQRIQASLMGHKFKIREEYGQGGTLAEKKECMDMTCLKQN